MKGIIEFMEPYSKIETLGGSCRNKTVNIEPLSIEK
jgi:hypothetical protein